MAATRPEGTRPMATKATTSATPRMLFSSQWFVHSQASWTWVQGRMRRGPACVWMSPPHPCTPELQRVHRIPVR